MKAQCLVDLFHEMKWHLADHAADAFDGDGSDLFRLCLRVNVKTGLFCRKQRLERIDALDVLRDGNDRYDALAKSLRRRVRTVIAHDDAGASTRCFTPYNLSLIHF